MKKFGSLSKESIGWTEPVGAYNTNETELNEE